MKEVEDGKRTTSQKRNYKTIASLRSVKRLKDNLRKGDSMEVTDVVNLTLITVFLQIHQKKNNTKTKRLFVSPHPARDVTKYKPVSDCKYSTVVALV